MTNIDYPFHINNHRRTAYATDDKHIQDLIEQVLFTSPGERVNRPTFGSGLLQLVFSSNSSELATATQFLVQGALQQWLNDLIQVETVQIENKDEVLEVTVRYIIRRNQQRQIAQFLREV